MEDRELVSLATSASIDATQLAKVAHAHAGDGRFRSPFSRSAAAAGLRYDGGKMDDITVVVAVVETVSGPASQP